MSDKEINILLLGETGVEKSTFINAFPNYLSYETLKDAFNGEIISFIPTQFVIIDENLKEITVKYGKSEDQCFEKRSQSSTHSFWTYSFKYGNCIIRLIDTPGIGDTKGLEEDKKNLEDILSFIADYKELNLICILLRPDLQRLTPFFVYCLKQLFYHLEKEASTIIVFMFTNQRHTFNGLKNSLVLLRELFDEIKTNPPFVEISFDKKKMFCLDNDSFQFLIANRNGIKFGDKEKVIYSINWIKSVNECHRLINYINTGSNGFPLKVHSIKNMSINETLRLIVTLAQPNAEIVIQIELFMNEIEINEENNKNLFDSNQNEFTLNCWHYLPIVGNITIPSKLARLEEAQPKINNFNKQMVDRKNSSEKKTKRMFRGSDDIKEQFLKEKQIIVKSSAKFTVFLKYNSITTYVDFYKEYIQAQIENLRKTEYKRENQTMIEILERTIREYEREKDFVENDIKSVDEEESDISLENINKVILRLYELKFTGEQIKRLHQQNKTTNDQDKKEEQLSSLAHLSSSIIDGIKNLFNFH